MRILLKVASGPGVAYLVSGLKPGSVACVLRLVETASYSEAIVAALSGGGSITEVGLGEDHAVPADLVITRESAHWDLCGR